MNRAIFLVMIPVLFASAACAPVREAAQNSSAEATPMARLLAPEPMRVIQAHPAETSVRISWSPDGKLLASGGWDDEVIVWDAATLERAYTFTHPEMAYSSFTSFSPNGRWLMVSEGRRAENDDTQAFDEVSIWDLETGTRVQRVTDQANVLKAVWSPDGNMLAYTISSSNGIQFWSAPDAVTTVPDFVTDPLTRIANLHWLADGTLLAIKTSEADPSRVFLWRSVDPGTLLPLQGSYADAFASEGIFSADGSWIAAVVSVPAVGTANGVDASLHAWDTATGDLRFTLPGHELYGFVGIPASTNNSWFAMAKEPSSVTGNASEVRIWDLASGGVIATLPGGSSSIVRTAFSPDGKTLAAGEANGEIRLWQLDAYLHPPVTSTPIPTTTPVPISNVSLTYISSFSVSGVNPDEPVTLNSIRWLEDGTVQGGAYFESAFSPDRSKVAYWDPGDLSGPEAAVFGVYEAATNAPLFQIQGSEQFASGGIAGISWAPDGKRIAVQSPKAIQVFDVPTGARVMTLENVIEQDELVVYDKVFWSPDGKWIASNLQGPVARSRVMIWEAGAGAVHRMYEQEPAGDPWTVVDHIAFSPDSSKLLLVKGNVEILDVLTGELQTLPAGTDLSQFVGTGSWSSDGVYVAVDYREVSRHTASVLIWNTKTGEVFILLRRTTESYSDSNLVWAPDRPWLATIDQAVVHILDAERQSVVRLEPRTITAPRVVSWSPAGSQLAVGSEDRTVEIWAFSE